MLQRQNGNDFGTRINNEISDITYFFVVVGVVILDFVKARRILFHGRKYMQYHERR